MTTATANKTFEKDYKGASIDQPDQSPSTLSRLLGYMVSGDQRTSYIWVLSLASWPCWA